MKQPRSSILYAALFAGVKTSILVLTALPAQAQSYQSSVSERTRSNQGLRGSYYELTRSDLLFAEGEASSQYSLGQIAAGQKVEVLKMNKHMARVRLSDGRVVFVRNRLLKPASESPSRSQTRADSPAPLPPSRPASAKMSPPPSLPPMRSLVADQAGTGTGGSAAGASTAAGTDRPSVTTPASSSTPGSVTAVIPTPVQQNKTPEKPSLTTATVDSAGRAPVPVVAPTSVRIIPMAKSGDRIYHVPLPETRALPETASAGSGVTTASLQPAGTSAAAPVSSDATVLPTLADKKVEPSQTAGSGTSAATGATGTPRVHIVITPGSVEKVPEPPKPPTSAKAQPAPAPKCDPTREWQTPLRSQYRVTSCIGNERGGDRLHAGLDIAGAKAGERGAPIMAVASGHVIRSGFAQGYGCLVIVQHDACPKQTGKLYSTQRCTTRYAHMQTKTVRQNGRNIKICDVPEEGTRVTACSRVGGMSGTGSSGRATDYPSHLHFEMRDDSESVVFNPLVALPDITQNKSYQAEGSYKCESRKQILAVDAEDLHDGNLKVRLAAPREAVQ